MSEWISVEYRLPEKGCRVLAVDISSCIETAKLNDDMQWVEDSTSEFLFEFLFDATHWMPLPEPPKDE